MDWYEKVKMFRKGHDKAVDRILELIDEDIEKIPEGIIDEEWLKNTIYIFKRHRERVVKLKELR